MDPRRHGGVLGGGLNDPRAGDQGGVRPASDAANHLMTRAPIRLIARVPPGCCPAAALRGRLVSLWGAAAAQGAARGERRGGRGRTGYGTPRLRRSTAGPSPQPARSCGQSHQTIYASERCAEAECTRPVPAVKLDKVGPSVTGWARRHRASRPAAAPGAMCSTRKQGRFVLDARRGLAGCRQRPAGGRYAGCAPGPDAR